MTKPSTPEEYIAAIEEPRRGDFIRLHELIRKAAPDLQPKIWDYAGPLIGYGTYHYAYASGREGDWFVIGLAAKKKFISLYLIDLAQAKEEASKLPGLSFGKGCINISSLEGTDMKALERIIKKAPRSLPER